MPLTFLSGALTLGYLVAALYFLRFRRDTGDRLFLYFAAAFALFAAQRMMPLGTADFEPQSYVVRLLAFLLILVGIVDKNMRE